MSDIHYEDPPSFILFVKYQYIIKYIPKPDMVVQDRNLIAWHTEVQYVPEHQSELDSEFQSILGCAVQPAPPKSKNILDFDVIW